MKLRTGIFSLTIVAIVIIGIVLGCGGSASSEACSATVIYENKVFDGKGKDAGESKRNSCNNYCRDADPEYDARYHIWLDSAAGRNAGSPSKQDAIFKDKDLMKFVTETCSRVCVAEMKPESTCK
ncbi:MAG TPA: hypothetical protein VHQ01_10685 [Pyrinomonadaceae bacterium]|nr:hypothetical protein [Pyrinomonadaceae bacterium]